MLPALAFLAALGNPADDFIDECAKAALGIKEGVWSMTWMGEDRSPYKLEAIRKGRTFRMRQTSGDAVLYDAVAGTTSTLTVYNAVRRFLVQNYPARPAGEKPPALPPLKEGEFKFNIDSARGFILRSNPAFQLDKIVVEGGNETMTAKVRKKDGKEANVTLVRDAKSKLPTFLKVVTPKETTEIHLSFKARKVDDTEVTIDPESYKGFQRVEIDETDSKETAALRKTLDAFVAASAKAVLAVEGTWTQENLNEGEPPQKIVMLRKGDAMRSRYYSGSTPTYDTLFTSSRSLMVNFAERQFIEAAHAWKRADPAEPNTCNFSLRLPKGVRLEASPFFTAVAVDSSGGEETLKTKWREADGTEWTVSMTRDAKTKLPSLVLIGNAKGSATIRTSFKSHKVSDADLAIDPESYKGFEKTAPPSGNL